MTNLITGKQLLRFLALRRSDMRLALLFGKLVEFWGAAQVELHGWYSVERVRELIDYKQRSSTCRSVLVLILMPWLSVVITILVDLISLRPPSEGLQTNYLFIIRTFLACWVASTCINLQFRHTVPTAPLPNGRVIVSSAFTAGLTTGIVYLLSLNIGFPLPFSILTVSPAWVFFLLAPLLSWLQRARLDPEVWLQIVNTLKYWIAQELLVLIYPPYFYIFTTLPADAKTPFAFLLPIIKICLRNLMARTVVHMNDEIPEIVLMNMEIFNSLFMSYCMQNTTSIWTTLGLIAIDGAQMLASMHDVGLVIQHLRIIKKRVNAELDRQQRGPSTTIQPSEPRRKTILLYTLDIFNRYVMATSSQVTVSAVRTPEQSSPQVVPLGPTMKVKTNRGVSKKGVLVRTSLKQSTKFSLRKVFSVRENDLEDKTDVRKLELEYALQVRKVLYITEFILLINYIEVNVPIIFSVNLLVMYHLPNHVYYSQIVNMNDEQFWETLGNVMLYCFLQIVSLVILCFVLWHKLAFQDFVNWRSF